MSPDRMATYRNATSSETDAIVLYLWNLSLSESLYSALALLEVCLRNAIHRVLSSHFGELWFPQIFRGQALTEFELIWKRLSAGQGNPPVGKLVAALTFGKWVHLLSNARCGWVEHYPYRLYSVFPNYPHRAAIGAREIHELLSYPLGLRNRVMHHEPIFSGVLVPNKSRKPIEQVHRAMMTTMEWIDIECSSTARHVDRFEDVFQNGRGEIKANLSKRLALL
jgi:hypothetical protein